MLLTFKHEGSIHFRGICKLTFLWHKLWLSFKSAPKISVVNPLHELIFYRDVLIDFYLNAIFCNNWLSFRHRFDHIFYFHYVGGRSVCIWLHHGLSIRCISIWIIDLLYLKTVEPFEVETVNSCVSWYSISLDFFAAIVLPLERSINKLKLEGISFSWLWCIML